MYVPASGTTQVRKGSLVRQRKSIRRFLGEPVKRQQHKAKWHSDFLVEL